MQIQKKHNLLKLCSRALEVNRITGVGCVVVYLCSFQLMETCDKATWIWVFGV